MSTGVMDEYTIGASDITFPNRAPAVRVLVLAGSGALGWTTPNGAACSVGDGAYPLAAGSEDVEILAIKIHGTGGSVPASAALTIRVMS